MAEVTLPIWLRLLPDIATKVARPVVIVVCKTGLGLSVGYWTACGANLVPKLTQEPRNNGDDGHRFFESFVSVSLRSCWLVLTGTRLLIRRLNPPRARASGITDVIEKVTAELN